MMPFHPHLVNMIEQLIQDPPQSIQVALGELFPLGEEQVRAQWSELTKHTSLAQSLLTIRCVPARQQCMVCFEKYHPIRAEVSCSQCGSVGAKIIAGEEFFLEAIEHKDE